MINLAYVAPDEQKPKYIAKAEQTLAQLERKTISDLSWVHCWINIAHHWIQSGNPERAAKAMENIKQIIESRMVDDMADQEAKHRWADEVERFELLKRQLDSDGGTRSASRHDKAADVRATAETTCQKQSA